jgi:DNA-binding MarR family transcriptional regulator
MSSQAAERRSTSARSDPARATKKPVVPPGHRVPAHLARRFHQICLGFTAEMLEAEALTPIEYSVLAALDDHPGQDQRGLAARLGIDTASVSQMVDRLEKPGLIHRRVSLTDRRARVLRLTPAGTRLRRRLRPALLAAQERILAPLSRDERASLIDLLARVVEGNESYARPGNGRRKPKPRSLQLGNK